MFNFMFTPNKDDRRPIYEQLYNYVVGEICGGDLSDGERMPSKKALASHLGLSVNTIETAYSILTQEGWLRSVPRNGFFVTHDCIPPKLSDMPEPYKHSDEAIAPKPAPRYAADFRTGGVDIGSFPYATWIKLSKEVMYSSPEYLTLGDFKGDSEVRADIAKYLHEFRGISCTPDRIIIGAGIEYLMMLLCELLRSDTVFALEDPGYKKIETLLENSGKSLRYIGLDKSGICIDLLRGSGSDIAYVTPSHQFPTGCIMTLRRRKELISWASEKENRYIIEDDYNSEFDFSLRPVMSIQGMCSEKVIYLNTFSRVLAPSVRIAYMVLPHTLLDMFEKRFSSYSPTVTRFEQHTLARFISGGYFSRHLNRVKKIYRRRRDKLIRVLHDCGAEIEGERAGLHLVAKFKDTNAVLENAKAKNIRLYKLADYYHSPSDGINDDRVIIGYGGVSDDDIKLLREITLR